jgi:predicted DNA-binding transcriptional regulator AlpA
LREATEFTGVKKSTLAKYKKGTFGGGGFPVSVRKASNKDPLWRLSDIADWLYQKGKVTSELVELVRMMDVLLTSAGHFF